MVRGKLKQKTNIGAWVHFFCVCLEERSHCPINQKRKQREKREKIQLKKIRDAKENIGMDNTNIKRITSNYYKHLYHQKLENLAEMNRFLNTYN